MMSIVESLPQLMKSVLFGIRPEPTCVPFSEIVPHLQGAIDWIIRAQEASHDGGISAHFDLLRGRWAPSYPETTGYTIPSLLACATRLHKPHLRTVGIALADYLLDARTPEGGVGHWKHSDQQPPSPIVFDTGQVIFGWLAAFVASSDERYLRAAVRAGDWLLSVQYPSGAWNEYQHLDVAKTIDTRVAWALLKLWRLTGEDKYRMPAVRNLEWAVRQQDPDGWFRRCAFVDDDDPFTHTLAYAAEGLLESGYLLEEVRYVEAARLTADALLHLQRPDGSLASTYGPGWRETSRSSCLTGNCQIARLWLRLYAAYGDQAYCDSARNAIRFVARTQNLTTPNPNTRGGIAGSHPIYGCYERFLYPNWAAKFFIDALLALQEADEEPDG